MKISKLLFIEPPRNYWFVMGEYCPPPTTLLILAAFIERELPGIEIEVLDCLAEGLSNREIGQRLTISLTTVKTHTRNIYRKLDVTSRTQAVAKGKALGIGHHG